jgi:precorrin isomerase
MGGETAGTAETAAGTDGYEYRKSGADIYTESFRIIRAEADLSRFPADVERVVVRMCHAAGDVTIADEVEFSPHVVAAAEAALAGGAPILCDSTMVATGIIRARLPRANDVVCLLPEPGLADLARERGTTKTAAAVELWAERGLLAGAVVAIGECADGAVPAVGAGGGGIRPPSRGVRDPGGLRRGGRIQAGPGGQRVGPGLPRRPRPAGRFRP